jgi:ribosomal-protein-alanine N-acetyltransferase
MEAVMTPRLKLITATRAALTADLEGAHALAQEIGVHVPDNWPPDFYDEPAIQWSIDRLTAGTPPEWLLYYWILPDAPDTPTVVGLGGFKGPPVDGRVEIGYSLLTQYRRNGYASEVVAALVKHAFEHGVEEVIAETLPQLIASIGVLEKNGFMLTGEGSEEGVIRFALKRNELP